MALPDTKSFSADPRRIDGCRGFYQLQVNPLSEDKHSRIPAHDPVRPRRPTLPRLRMCAFEPRHFPPPELADVPLVYILAQLRRLAPYYWCKPETADCTLIIPTNDFARTDPHHVQRPSSFTDGTVGSERRMHDPSGLGRRATEPATLCLPPIVMKLHVDYLCAQSSLLRALFGGASPLDLIDASALPPSFSSKVVPRVLPSSEAKHPKIYLPVPDPASFKFIVHWCYFHDFSYLEQQLDRGLARWDGLARNAEYLGLGPDLKALLGRYYARVTGLHPRAPQNSPYTSEDEAPEDAGSESSSSSSSSEDDDDHDYLDEEEGHELPRGRTTSIRNIGSIPRLLLHARARLSDAAP